MPAKTLKRGLPLLLTSMLVWLQGCAIGTPWPRLTSPTAEKAEEPVVLVVTHVVVDTSQRREFDRQNRQVLDSMKTQPGLLGHAARRQVFGDQGWTMSVWANDEARAAFMRSAVHREAIAKSMPALRAVEVKRLTLARKDLPANWNDVLALLADPHGRRSYWD